MLKDRKAVWAMIGCVSLISGATTVSAAILDDDFTGATVDTSLWNVNVAQAVDSVATTDGTNLNVVNTDAGGFWGGGAGIWNKGAQPDTPLFNRPASGEINAYFFGVQLPAGGGTQRVAFGLSSFNAAGEGTGNPQTQFNFPDGDGNGEYLSYSFWIRPADFSGNNWVRTKTVNQTAAATAGAGEQEWAQDGSKRDYRIRILPNDVEWYVNNSSTGSEAGPWTLVRDPFDTGNALAYSGAEPGGRDSFRVFVHGSAGATDGETWVDADLRIDRILVVPEPASMTLLGLGGLAMLKRRKH
jgi:PEP-CTERM motif